jgi:hypothetical protein
MNCDIPALLLLGDMVWFSRERLEAHGKLIAFIVCKMQLFTFDGLAFYGGEESEPRVSGAP